MVIGRRDTMAMAVLRKNRKMFVLCVVFCCGLMVERLSAFRVINSSNNKSIANNHSNNFRGGATLIHNGIDMNDGCCDDDSGKGNRVHDDVDALYDFSELKIVINDTVNTRRSIMTSIAAATSSAVLLGGGCGRANAGIDPSQLRNLPVQGDENGSAQRLRQIEELQRPSADTIDIPFTELPSGVSYREYREGKGEAVVQPGSRVGTEMTIRCKSFSTANEPGGVKYFSTKLDTEFNELAWTIGDGSAPIGLEDAMIGMHRNAIRRIELPSTMVFTARNNNQLPQPTTKDGKRIYERLFKTDATLLFEVLVTRVK